MISLGGTGYTHAADIQLMPPKWPWHGVSMGFPEATPKDLERYHKELGINVVRLQVKARQFAEKQAISGDKALDAGLLWADEMLDTCARLGVVAVVNISQFPLNPSEPEQKTPEFWRRSESRRGVLTTVRHVVESLRHRGNELVAYDFMSEPVIVRGGKSIAPEPWPELLQQIVTIVNDKDSKRWLLVSPGPWGGADGYLAFDPPTGARLIWGAHIYTPHAFTHQGIREISPGKNYPGLIGWRFWNKNTLRKTLQPLIDFNKQHPGPVFIGEFGAARWAEGGERYLRDLADMIADQGWGWAYFSGTGWHGWNPDYNQHYPGKDEEYPDEWKQDYVGDKSLRWQTLRSIFNVQGKQ